MATGTENEPLATRRDNESVTMLLPNSVPSNFEKLVGRSNFSEWKFTLRYHLEDRDLYKIVTGVENDEVKDKRARSAIVSSVTGPIIKDIQECDTAKAMLERLTKLYSDSNPNRFISLNQEMFATRFENCKNMTDYLDKMKTIGSKMRSILPAYPDQAVAANILTNLPEYFRPLVMALENSVTELTTDLVCEKLQIEYGKMTAPAQNAFATTTTSKSGSTRFNGSCNICGRLGHKAKFCKVKKSKGGDNHQHKKHNNTNSVSKVAQSTTSHVKEAWVATTMNTEEIKYNPWIIDSGSSRHMTPHREYFNNYKTTPPSPVKTGGTVIQSIGEGSVRIDIPRGNKVIELTVSNVLHVPDLGANLISVKYLARNNGIITVCDANYCKLIQKASGQIVATGTAHGDNLYFLDIVKHSAYPALPADSIMLWHRRMAHLSASGLSRLTKMVSGLDYVDNSDIQSCVSCIKGKQQRLSFPKNKKVHRANDRLELMHSDLCGPMNVTSLGGARYMFTLIDDFTRMTFVSFLKTKTEVYSKFVEFVKYIEKQTGKSIKALRSDRGGEYVNASMNNFLQTNGIHHELTIAYTPEQNGVAERCNRTLMERARSMLIEANLNKEFWAEAVCVANFCKNRSPTIAVPGKTPYEAWTGEKPNLNLIRTFGCKAFVHIPKERRSKLDDKSIEMIFVGYSTTSKGYRLYDPITSKIAEARDVIFMENFKNGKEENVKLQVEESKFFDEEEYMPIIVTSQIVNNFEPEFANNDNQSVAEPAQELRRSERELKLPNRYQDYEVNLPYLHHRHVSLLAENDDHQDVPLTYNEAISHPDADRWKGAIEVELEAHKRNHTWDLVELPANRKPIKCKWVFKLKCNSNGSLERYKARLVAKGYSQKEGIDYTETFSPVVRYETLRILVAFATLKNWEIHHVDAVVAFIQGSINEEIYMEVPDGLKVEQERGERKVVCRLHKAINGLKQSSRAWYFKLDNELKNNDFICSSFDSCVYYKFVDNDVIIIAIYVDDLILFSSKCELLNLVKEQLMQTFEMKDLGELHYCLGIEIKRDRIKGLTTLNQINYVKNLLHKFNMHDCTPVSTPYDINKKLMKISDKEERSESTKLIYQSAIGKLLYAAKGTRPDIAQAVGVLCQYCSDPSTAHWTAAKRVMRYLRGSTNSTLTYSREGNSKIMGYCDSDFAGSPDDRKSTTGFVFLLAGAAITWQSKKQPTVASSTTEAEYMALNLASKEAIWLRKLIRELRLMDNDDPIVIHSDNKGAIDLCKNNVFHARTKHIDIQHHFVRETVERNETKIQKIDTKKMIADSLTKYLPTEKFVWCANEMGINI